MAKETIKGQEPSSTPQLLKVETKPTVLEELDLGVGGYKIPSEALEGVDLDGVSQEADDNLKKYVKELDEEGQSEKEAEPVEESEDELKTLKKELDLEDETPDEAEVKEPAKDEKKYEVDGEELTLKELISGYRRDSDYRKKTMALAEDRKAYEREITEAKEELQNAYKEMETELNLKQQFDSFLDLVQLNDPDFYQELSDKYKEAQKHLRNPYFEAKIQKQEKLLETMQNKLHQADVSQYKNEFTSGIKEARAFAKKFEGMGFKWDEKKVAQEWADTGDHPLKCLKRLYADNIYSLVESKTKLAKLGAKAKKTIPNMGSVKTNGTATSRDLSKEYKNMSYSKIADLVLSGELH